MNGVSRLFFELNLKSYSLFTFKINNNNTALIKLSVQNTIYEYNKNFERNADVMKIKN